MRACGWFPAVSKRVPRSGVLCVHVRSLGSYTYRMNAVSRMLAQVGSIRETKTPKDPAAATTAFFAPVQVPWFGLVVFFGCREGGGASFIFFCIESSANRSSRPFEVEHSYSLTCIVVGGKLCSASVIQAWPAMHRRARDWLPISPPRRGVSSLRLFGGERLAVKAAIPQGTFDNQLSLESPLVPRFFLFSAHSTRGQLNTTSRSAWTLPYIGELGAT